MSDDRVYFFFDLFVIACPLFFIIYLDQGR